MKNAGLPETPLSAHWHAWARRFGALTASSIESLRARQKWAKASPYRVYSGYLRPRVRGPIISSYSSTGAVYATVRSALPCGRPLAKPCMATVNPVLS